MINGTSKAVASMTGNLASIGSGTFAPLATVSLGNATAMSSLSKDEAEAAAIKVCASVPDRCKEAMAAAK